MASTVFNICDSVVHSLKDISSAVKKAARLSAADFCISSKVRANQVVKI